MLLKINNLIDFFRRLPSYCRWIIPNGPMTMISQNEISWTVGQNNEAQTDDDSSAPRLARQTPRDRRSSEFSVVCSFQLKSKNTNVPRAREKTEMQMNYTSKKYTSAIAAKYFCRAESNPCNNQSLLRTKLSCSQETPCGSAMCASCSSAGHLAVEEAINEFEGFYKTRDCSEVHIGFTGSFKIKDLTPSVINRMKGDLLKAIIRSNIANHWWLGHMAIYPDKNETDFGEDQTFSVSAVVFTPRLSEDQYYEVREAVACVTYTRACCLTSVDSMTDAVAFGGVQDFMAGYYRLDWLQKNWVKDKHRTPLEIMNEGDAFYRLSNISMRDMFINLDFAILTLE